MSDSHHASMDGDGSVCDLCGEIHDIADCGYQKQLRVFYLAGDDDPPKEFNRKFVRAFGPFVPAP